MGTRMNYWCFMRLNANGTYRVLEVSEAKTFFHQQFSDPELTTASDETVQQRLLDLWRNETKPSQTRSLAESCLWCLISNQIHHVCQQLANQFGAAHGFTAEDLYPYVLTDVLPHPSNRPSQHLSLVSEILESYRSDKGSLSSWTIRRVRHHPELNAFLLECGVYLVSDWAILNDTSLGQVHRIFAQVYNLTPDEIQEACAVLAAYHAVYRGDRIQQRLHGRGGRRCEAPTEAQWEQIRLRLSAQPCFAATDLTVREVQRRVQHLATFLRDYRIYVRVGRMRTESLDQPETAAIANQTLISQSSDLDDDDLETQNQFLTQYRTQFSQALDEALAIAVDARVAKLKKRKPPVDHHYLTAMMLFHCQGMAMKDIAGHVELQKQFQVSRLMDLKPFRAQLREEMLCRLRDRVPTLAQAFVSPDQLKQLSQTLEAALDDEIVRLIEEAEAEANAVNRSAAPKSQFARHLCRHLDTRSSKQ
jgi:hypothetical protein